MGMLVIAVMFGCVASVFLAPTALAGMFGPDNYEECVLEKMKGQEKHMLPTARGACTKKFPPEESKNKPESNPLEFLLPPGASKSASEKTNKGIPAFTVYRNEQHGFEVSYPTSWEINKLSSGPVFALKNKDNNKLGVFSISVANLKMDEQQLWISVVTDKGGSLVEQTKARFGGATLRFAGETKLSGRRAYRTEIRYVLKNLNPEIPMINIQIMAAHNSRVYLINFESPESSFDENKVMLQAVAHSFNFLT